MTATKSPSFHRLPAAEEAGPHLPSPVRDECPRPPAHTHGSTLAVAAALSLTAAGAGVADEGNGRAADGLFTPVSTFDVMDGNGSEVAEIVDATRNGKQLVYTDGGKEEIGFVDISDPRNPIGKGTVDVGGEPTSLVVKGRLVLVAVNTSQDFVKPNGKLVVVNRTTRRIVAERELRGQPDSIALSPNGRFAAIVIENERDEDLNDGLIPQYPTGGLLIVDLRGRPASARKA